MSSLSETPPPASPCLHGPVGIGDDYDEALLAGMVEAGGGRLHDAADAPEITLTFAEARQNSAQRRNAEVSLAALTVWQSETMRRAIQLNRAHDRRRARHYLSKELRYIEAYASALAGAEAASIGAARAGAINQRVDRRGKRNGRA